MSKESKKAKANKTPKAGGFLKNTKAELKKVIWPNFKQLSNNTIAVISIVVIIGLIVFVLDVCFNNLSSLGIEKLKAAVSSENTISQEADESSTDVDQIVSDIQANIDAQSEDVALEEVEDSNLGE